MCQRREWPNAFKFSAILLLLALLVATVASVPTSVLAQNSELSANNDIESLNKLKLSNKIKNNSFLAKVKRSSDKTKASEKSSETTTAPAASSNLEKKSSPEVVPASFNAPPQKPMSSAPMGFSLPANPDLINTAIAAGLTAAAVEAAAAANQRDQAQLYDAELHPNNAAEEAAPPALLHKRGISLAQQEQQQQQQYSNVGDDGYYTNPYLTSASLPVDGVWADELETPIGYAQLQDLDDYMTTAQRAPSYRPRAFESLQSLNAEAYLEPLPYASRYYGAADRSKRSNSNKLNRYAELRTKLTPADMLALVALVEAGERDRKDNDIDADANSYNPRNYYGNNVGVYDYPTAPVDEDIDDDFNAGVAPANLYEPSALLDYYGTPVNFETIPAYEVTAPHEHKYGNRNRFAVKRFMVAKKSGPLGKFLNEPVAKPTISYSPIIDQFY